ncbi:MAG: VapC toxin family PIN domain ribonuclease [Pseudomonadota bacterium]|nr:VapC toxin family PIN domain ribonuclease [Pseudomonadota bacterium]
MLTLADSGYFIGLFDPRDAHHARCLRFSERHRGVLLTAWPVFTEVSALLPSAALRHFFAWAAKAQAAGHLRIDNPLPEQVNELWDWMARYSDLPMDFCDASLVLLAIRHRITRIATTDMRDFTVYRLPRRQHFVHVLYEDD